MNKQIRKFEKIKSTIKDKNIKKSIEDKIKILKDKTITK